MQLLFMQLLLLMLLLQLLLMLLMLICCWDVHWGLQWDPVDLAGHGRRRGDCGGQVGPRRLRGHGRHLEEDGGGSLGLLLLGELDARVVFHLGPGDG